MSDGSESGGEAQAGAAGAAAKKKRRRPRRKRPAEASGGSVFDALKLHVSAEAALPAAADALSSKVHARGEHFAFRVAASPTKGRCAVAAAAIPEGALLVREEPVLFFVDAAHARSVCAHCVADAAPARVCARCGAAAFCSAACEAAARELHAFECGVLPRVAAVAAETGVDADLVRAALRYLALRAVPPPPPPPAAAAAASSSSIELFVGDAGDEEAMALHTADEAAAAAALRASELLLSLLPAAARRQADAVARAMHRVNASAHQLTRAANPTERCGLGLFPLCALFNHSCWPNVSYTNAGRRLEFRALRAVAAGEELCVSYGTLYATRASRRAELQREKGFFCRCPRCALAPVAPDELRGARNDELVEAVRCRRAGCAGHYRQWRAGAREAMRCSACEDEAPEAELRAVEAECAALLAKAEARQGDAEAADAALRALSARLHAKHELSFRAQLLVAVAAGQQRDVRARLEALRRVVAMARDGLPRNFILVANYAQALADAAARYADARGAQLPRAARAALRQERIDALAEAAAALTALCGPAHAAAAAAQRALEEARRARE